MSDLIERIKQRMGCHRWKMANDTTPLQALEVKFGNEMLDMRLNEINIIDEEVAKEQQEDGWIPITERMPECEEEVYITTRRMFSDGTYRYITTTAMYEDGKMSEEESDWNWTDIEMVYDEETDTRYIPEGWWEYKHYNCDDVYNNIVDDEVIAWMPKPESYKPD